MWNLDIKILIGVIITILTWFCVLYREKIIFNINWNYVLAVTQILVMAATIIFIASQAYSTKELVEKTMRPQISMGLVKTQNPTNIGVFNYSNFPAWVWVDIEFIEDKKDKKLVYKYTQPEQGFPMSPRQAIIVKIEDKNLDLYIQEKKQLYAIIKYRSAVNSDDPGPKMNTTNITYRYDLDRLVWVIDGIGSEFYLPISNN